MNYDKVVGYKIDIQKFYFYTLGASNLKMNFLKTLSVYLLINLDQIIVTKDSM